MDVYQIDEILEDHKVWLETDGQDGIRADFARATLDFIKLSKTDLRKAIFQGASLVQADLREANLQESNLVATDLTSSDLRGANLQKAELNSARLIRSNLAGADLRSANLMCAELIETNIMYANLTGCSIYGTSVWDLKINDKTMQSNLIITKYDEPAITVDDLEVAQFIYLLLHNEKIRNVIDKMGEKGLFILCRFISERKVVLDAIRDSLRPQGFIPMMFDFERPTQLDFSVTVHRYLDIVGD